MSALNFRKINSRALKELVYGGHLLSLGASSIVLAMTLIDRLTVNLVLVILPYLLSQIIYNYNHYREFQIDIESNPERTHYIHTLSKRFQVRIIVYLVVLCSLLLATNICVTTLILGVLVCGVLYTEIGKKYLSSKIIGAKNFYTASLGAITTLIVPCYYQVSLSSTFKVFIVFVFIRLLVNSIFFDIKDISADRKVGIKTIANQIGKIRTLRLLQFINLSSVVLLILSIYHGYLTPEYIVFGSLGIYGFLYLIIAQRANIKMLRNISYFIVDGEYIFWALISAIIA